MSTVRERLVCVGPGQIAHTTQGSGPPLLLIHGIPTWSYLWRNVAPRFADGLTVHTVDLLGYGKSDQPAAADLSLAAQTCYLIALLEQSGWTQGTVVGHDIGGGVAQLLAVARPDLVQRLILLDSVCYDSFPEPSIARLKDPAWDHIMETLDLAKGLAKGLERGMTAKERVTPGLVAAYEQPFAGRDGRRAYLRCARALAAEDLLPAMPRVEQLAIPTLIVWGDSDVYQDIAYGRRLAAAMPQAELVVLQDAGHFLPEDKPVELAELVARFIRVPHPASRTGL